MYFNRKNAAQKNWRMIKKGKHFLFGCSLVFAVGAALVAPSVKADTVAGKGEAETTTTNPDNSKASPDEEVGTYKAPATVATQPVAVKDAVVAEKPTVKVVNKEALTKLIEEVKGLDKTGKTEDSLSRLNTALEQAQKVLTNAEASQDQVDAAVASLKEEKATTVAAEENAEATEDKAVPTDETTETSATQPKSRSRRSVGQERDQGRSMEGQDIKFEYKSGKKVENGDPTQRAKIEYRQLDDYEVVNGKTVATDPSGQGRPVLEWTVTFNEAKWDKPGGFWYFSIPKNVSDPYNVVTEYDGGTYATRTEWNNGDGNANAEGKQFIDDGSKLESRVKLTTGGNEYDKVPGLNGVMANSKKLYVLQTNIYSGIRKFTVRYRTVVEDPSQTISYIAGVQAAKNLAVNNWYAISGKYDKELVSQVATPSVTPNLENTSVNVPVKTVASTSSTLSGTGVPGATIKLYIDGQEQNIGNVTVDNDGKWTTGELPTALNNNQGDGTTIKPRQTVEVSQVVNGTESSRRTVPVSLGVTTVEPSSLTTNKDAVVAGQKEVTLKVPHDAGIAYMRYTNTAGQIVEIPVKRDSLSAAWTSEKPEAATVKRVDNGKFQDTIVLTMADKIAGTEVAAISNVVEGGFSSVADWQPRSVENQAPTIASAVEGNKKTVTQGAQLNLASLVTVADKEDDAQATLGDKVHAEVVSVNGNTATKTVDTNTQGTYTVQYKAVDSQGLGSNEIEVTVVVNPARQNEAPTVSIQYSDPKPSLKEVYLYNGEEADVDITFNDDSGKIKSAALKKGGNQALNNIDGNPDKQDNEFGYTVTAINSETATPAKIKVTGQVSGIAADKLPKTESDSLKLVTRFATATDTDGAFIVNDANRKEDPVTKEAVGTYLTDPGAVTFVLKAQTKKYDIKTPASADKVTVSNANNVTDKEFKEIKAKVKLEYSRNNPDERLADKKGTEVENQTERIESITREGKNVVVTYKDGSKDTKALADFVNVAPKVKLPYSNQANKQIYVYTGENTDLTFKGTDEKEIKDLYLRGPGDVSWNNAADYGLPTGKVENGAVTGEGSVTDKRTATIKMTGVTTLTAGKEWTSFVVSKDNDGKLSNTDYRALDQDPKAKEKPGYVRFVVKNQTSKYDIATPTEKVEVADPANVTKDDLAKIKEKLQIEYAQTNDDANFADKKGKTVDAKDAKTKIESVAKDNAGNLVVTYTDGSTDTKPLSEFVTKAKPTQPKITTDLTGKAGTKTPVEVTAEPGTKVELFDKDGKKIGEGTADNNGKVTITPTVDIPAGNVTAKATKDGQTSDASKPKEATAATPAKPTQPKITTDLTGKAGTKTPVEVTAEPGSTVKLFDKDGNKIGEGTAGPDGKVTITPTVDIPAGNVTAKATKDGQTSDASAPKEATAATAAKPSQPVVTTDLTGKAGTKTPVEVTAEPGTKVELFDKDGNKIGEGTAGTDGKATINPTVDIPAGNVTAKATKDGKTSDESAPKVATAATPAKPSQPVVTTDLTGKAGTKTPVEVTAEPGSTVKLFDKDGNKIGEGTAGTDGKATINPTVDIPAGNVTAKATKDGKTSDESAPKVATAATPAKPSQPVVTTDLTGKAGTKTPVEVTAEPGSTVKLFDKDGKKIGEGTAGPDGKVTITPTVDIPAGNVTAKATKDGQTSDASKPKEATAATPTPAKPSKPVVETDLTGKAGTKTPVEVTAEPGTKVELFDKDGKKIGEGTADNNGKVTITPTVDIPAGNVTAKATKDGQTSDASKPKEATAATPAKPSTPVVDTDLTGKAGTKTPVEVTAEPGTKVELFDKDGNKIGEGTAGTDGKATINPTVDIPAGNVTAKATKDGKTSDESAPKVATAATPATDAGKNKVTDPAVTPVTDPSNLTDAEKAKVVDEVKKSNPTVSKVEVGNDGTTTVTYPDGTTAVIPADKTVKKSADKAVKDPSVTPVADPSNLTDAEKGKVAEEVKKSNPTAKDVEVGKDGTTTVTFPDGSKAEIPAAKTVKKSADKAVKDPTVTPVTDPSNLTDAEKGKVAEEVKKSNPTVSKVEVGNDGTTTVTYPDGTTAVIPADKTVKKSDDKVVTDPSVTPVTDPSNLTDAEKGKVAEEVKKANPTVSKVEVGNDGTATVTYPDGTTAVIPADKTVKKSADKAVKDPTVTPVTDPSNLTDAEKAKVADEVKKSNPTVSKVEVGNDGTTTVTYPDGTTAVIPADKTVKKSADKAVKDPTVTPVTDPSNLTDAEKAKVADEVKKSNPTVSKVEVGNDGTTTVTYPDGTTAVIPADKTVKKSADKVVTDPSVTPVTDPSNLTDAEKTKVAEEVKKANPTVSKVEVGNDGTTTVTYPDGTTAVIPADKTVKKSADKAVKDPTVTPVTDPSNLTDAEKVKVADEVKKSNPTVTDVKVDKDGTTTVTYPDGTTAVIPADKTVKKSVDKGTKDPSVTPVTDPSNLTDAEKAKVADEVKKANPTVSKVEVGNDGTTTVTYPDGTPAVIPADKTVKKSADKAVKDPTVTPVTDPSNLTDAEKAKVSDEVKKSNPTVSKVEVGNDGTTTVTYPDGTTAVIPADKTVKKSADKAVKDPSVTPVTDPSNLTDAEKAKVADEVKKSNPTVSKVEVSNDGTTTVTYPDGTTAVIPADKTVKKSADKAVKDPSVTPVTDPSNLTDAEKAKVTDEVKKSNPTVSKVEVGNDGTTTVTYPDGTTAVIPSDKTVKKSADKAVKDPSVTPVTDPSNLTDAEKAKVADEVKKSNPTVSKVEVSNDGTTTVTYPDGTTAVIPADKTVKKSADKAVKDPSVTPVKDPSNLTDAEKAKVADEVKKSNPTVSKVEVGNGGTTTVTYPDGTTAVIPADKTVKKSADKAVKDPTVTPVADPSNLTDAEKAKVADEVKKSNPTVSKVEVGNDGTTTVTYPDGTTAVIPADKTVKKSADKAVKDPSVTPVADPSNLTDAEKGKVADEVKKANPTVTDVKVEKDGTTTVTYPDGTTAVIPADKTVKKSADKVVTNPTVTPVVDPSNLTDAEKAKVADKVKKANPTASKVEVGNDGTATVTFPDGSVAVLTPAKTVKSADSNGVKNPSVTPVTDPSNLTDAEKAKVADEVKKANPTATDIKVNNDGSVVVTFADGSVAVIPAEKSVTAANQDSPAQAPAKKAGAKELPNTGTEQSSASLALALLAAVTGGLLFAKKREEEE